MTHQDQLPSSGPRQPERPGYAATVIRVIDVSLATILAVLLSPLMLLIGIFVLISDGRPIVFRQTRTGLAERPFRILKFRTLKTDASDSDRNFLGGRLLRRTSLDELPQLFNIIKGDMSFVGPRPLLPEYGPYYLPEERIRFLVRPGLTGLAQVSGRSMLSWDEKLATDAAFVRAYSVATYAKILLKTPVVVLSGRGSASNWTSEARLDVERAGRD